MPTEVHPFLPEPASAAHLREAYPYGPSPSGFHTDLAIEVDPSQLDENRVVAVVSGMARLVLDPLSPQTCTLVLTPHYNVMTALSAVLGKTVVAFVYRNLTKPDLLAPALTAPAAGSWPAVPLDGYRVRIQQLDVPTIPVPEPTEQMRQFLDGEIPVEVVAGDRMFIPDPGGGQDGWGRLGFEIVFIPSGLLGEHGWHRLQELIDPDAMIRRLDPMSFYARVKAAPDTLSLMAEQGHALFTKTTHRSLVEIRDEYDRPFIGTAHIYDGGQTTPFDSDASNRGTFVLPSNTTFSNVEVPDYVITELPSGDKAEPANKNFTATDHWSLQTIYMRQNPFAGDEGESWFVENHVWQRFTENNKVTPIRDGVEVFRQYAEAIRTLSQPGHFVYIVDWWMDKSFELVEGESSSTMAQLTRHADSHGAEVRALLWKQHGGQNSSEAYDINHLNGGNGQAILDEHTHDCTTTPETGTHHQKFLVVYGSGGDEFAFCGGVDINQNRRDSPRHGAKGGYHDVHAKVEGPAVGDIHRTFAERWNTNPDNPGSTLSGVTDKFNADAGSVFVQVAQTYPRRSTNPYPFAPQGSTTPLQAFRRAIKKAKKFIYIEDQYLTPYPGSFPYVQGEDTVGILWDLREALATIDYLIMVIPNHARQGWLYNLDIPGLPIFTGHPGQNRYRRLVFIQSLMQIAPEKVHVYFLGRSGHGKGPGEVAETGDGPYTSGSPDYPNEIYCHSKVWIVDDVIAKIGSANCNRRSYTHDTEMDIVMVDGALDNGARRFARDFRLQLWAEHLDIPQSERGILEDHKLALHYWLPEGRFSGARIRDYNHLDLGAEAVAQHTFWDTYVDPDGIT